jgi:glycerol-3-phosphate dehydrogenase (NAD(P)+)
VSGVPQLTAGRVAVVGGGAWGTTVAALAAANGATTLWAREPDVVTAIRDHHENRRFLPGFELPAALDATDDLEGALAGAAVVVVAVPAQYMRAVMARASGWIARDALVVSVTKGLEVSSSKRMTEVLAEVLSEIREGAIGVLAGPNLAREVIEGHPSATTVAFADPAAAAVVQARLAGPTFRVYTSTDVVGCEIGGAVKNVIAIAAGVADGLGYGTNTMAALVTRGVAEVARLGIALGGDPMTFLGLSGSGDLVATCGSRLSRNHRVGRELAAGSTVEEIIGRMTSVTEGVTTAPVVVDLARRHGVEMPIAETVTALLDRRIAPADAITMLMGRDPRPELHGLQPHASPS